ncbi:MAG: histidinol-phosphatase [Clostridia bacterium]|nr:histidinol-phosphatase [Clostridia bacterium]
MKANYHTHTPRCHHAGGTEEEYVKAAIGAGFDVLGFSDHTPWPYKSDFVSHIRMLPQELPGYVSTVQHLKEAYKDQITLRLGLECEYYPMYMDWLQELHERMDYLILGAHYLNTDESNPYVVYPCKEDKGMWAYVESSCEALQTGLFTYMAHPDLFMRYRPAFDKESEKASHALLTVIKELGLPIEYNLNGQLIQQREKEPGYPRREFWEFAASYGIPAIIGVDAHTPKLLANEKIWEDAHTLLTQLGYTIIDCLPFDEKLKEGSK